MRVLNLYEQYGKHCYIAPYTKGKVLKIFNIHHVESWDEIKTFLWGDIKYDDLVTYIPLWQASIIQNIAYSYGFAPCVFEIVGVRIGPRRHFAQILENIGDKFCNHHEEAYDVYEKVQKIGQDYGFRVGKQDVSKLDVLKVNSKYPYRLVDFNSFYFDKEDWMDRIDQHADNNLKKIIKPFYLDNLIKK